MFRLRLGFERILNKASPKVKAVLRTRKFYSVHGLIQQYKSHVLCILECTCGSYFHAATTHLHKLDMLQTKFVEKLGLSARDAFVDFNLAPLRLRRNISALGLLYKIAKRQTHPDLHELFPLDSQTPVHNTRLASRRHKLNLQDKCDGTQSEILNRSIFGMVRVFDALPEQTIACPSVKLFQKALTQIARERCEAGECVEKLFDAR